MVNVCSSGCYFFAGAKTYWRDEVPPKPWFQTGANTTVVAVSLKSETVRLLRTTTVVLRRRRG